MDRRFYLEKLQTFVRYSEFALCLALIACGPADQPKVSGKEKAFNGVIATLPADPAKAEKELERRLDASIKVQDGFLVIHDPIMGTLSLSILPINSPWVMNCGLGVSITFGTSVSGADGDVSNDNQLGLSFEQIDQKKCNTIALPLAKHLQAMLSNTSPPN